MTDPIVRSTPKPYYWFISILVYPVAAIVFTAVLIRPVLLLAGMDLRGRPLILVWLLITALVAAWAYIRDYRRLHYTLSPQSITIGRGAAATIVPFTEIESIVLALPDRLAWWLRMQRFNPKGRAIYQNIIRARELTLLLRLTNSRYLPLNLSYNFLANGHSFLAAFIRSNESKIVGPETYTEQEIQGLTSAQSNTITTINRNG
jgi:hypothetical protein